MPRTDLSSPATAPSPGRAPASRRRFPTPLLRAAPALLAAALTAGGVLAGVPAAADAQALAFVNARVVDVDAGSVSGAATVVVEGRTIRSVEVGGAPPPGARVVDLGGMYLAPGLMDAHVHVGSLEQARRALLTGVTTMRSMGADQYADVGIRELQRGGWAESPEYLAAGYHVRPPAAESFFYEHPELGHLMETGVRGEEAVSAMVRANLSHGVDFIKTNATERAGLPDTDPRKRFYSDAELRAVVAAAGDVPVAAHAHGDAGARGAVEAGVRSIEHGTYMSEATLRLMRDRGTFLVPTIAIVRDLTIPGGDYDDAVLNIRGRHMLPRVREMARNAHRLGVAIGAATDTGYGAGSTTTLAHELIELVGIGMTPAEALRAATTVNARLFGVADRTGRVVPGLEADLIVLERNPLDDIAVVQDVLMVVSDGRIVVQRGDALGGRPVS